MAYDQWAYKTCLARPVLRMLIVLHLSILYFSGLLRCAPITVIVSLLFVGVHLTCGVHVVCIEIYTLYLNTMYKYKTIVWQAIW